MLELKCLVIPITVVALTGSYLLAALEKHDYHWIFVLMGVAVLLLRWLSRGQRVA